MSKDLALFTLLTARNYDITQLYADVSGHTTRIEPNEDDTFKA